MLSKMTRPAATPDFTPHSGLPHGTGGIGTKALIIYRKVPAAHAFPGSS